MLYKYRSFKSQYKYDVFTKKEVYLASPQEFNDPFESKPQLIGLDTFKEREEIVDRIIKKSHADLKYKQKKSLKKQILIRLSDKSTAEEDISALLKSFGILSLSSKWDQVLMWSHYSDSHQGFCIGFEFDDIFDHDVGLHQVVTYEEEYPKLHPDIFINNDIKTYNEGLIKTLVATKSRQWSYEDETRYIKTAKDGGSGVYKFKGKKLKEVVIGAYTSTEDKKELLDVLSKHMPWVNIYQAKLSKYKYEVTKEPII
ncbi:MAG: DUF2971 domain-containing protein [Methylophagaceae bacterium]